jgi:hypothetical protein
MRSDPFTLASSGRLHYLATVVLSVFLLVFAVVADAERRPARRKWLRP